MERNVHTLRLERQYFDGGTNGTLYLGSHRICHTIELPWRNNKPQVSCIPAGRYRLQKRVFRRHGEQIAVAAVSGRQAILLHSANDAQRELRGCIAPVMKFTGAGTGLQSREALVLLKAVVYELWSMEAEVYLQIM